MSEIPLPPSEPDPIAAVEARFYAENIKERLTHQVQIIQEMLKHLVIVNGGAIVAMFTLLGTGKVKLNQAAVQAAFVGFSSGLACAFIAWFAGYWSQERYTRSGHERMLNAHRKALGIDLKEENQSYVRLGTLALSICIAFSLVGIISFVVGSAFALAGVS